MEMNLIPRIAAISKTYLLYILPGALITIAFLPFFRALLLPYFNIFAVLILCGVALQVAGINLEPKYAPPKNAFSRWLWALRVLTMPQVVLLIALVASVLHGLLVGISSIQVTFSQDVLRGTIPVAAGFGLTLLCGIAAGVLSPLLDRTAVRYGGAAALILIAVMIAGVSVPKYLPLAVLGLAVIIGIIRTIFRNPAPGIDRSIRDLT